MPVTRKTGTAPLVLPSEANATAAAPAGTSTAKATSGPGPHHVRVHRSGGAGTERIISRTPSKP